jgi:methionyl aminopeptidase
MGLIKNHADLQGLRASGGIAARIRDRLAQTVAPGVTTGEIGDYAAELMKQNEAESAFLGYRGYPGVICVSVNEEVVHGIPGRRRIQLGDIVGIDVGVRHGGYVGDTATTVMVGVTDPDTIRLVRATESALEAAVKHAQTGHRLSDISHAIETVARENNCAVVRKFVGHGIGREMHEEPQVPNFGPRGRGMKLRSGMTLCLEPMLNLGGSDVKVLSDEWTVVTRDGSFSAHFEHMVALRNGEAEILSVGSNASDR